ncbi:TIGR02452 family protein [Actinocrinis puniceicyclus]|uniref:TIGR02452 family protein n=1 Tax=Actinocrinis puniceicyclus TaxID=977794 RepID=A0A8J7WTH4_9ACTN|nr:TIGR02452 family protein [Actinocrinis puniceicyclus]MBS2966177.1 TIGR02452 family protein [Actinocrinis puniceicyclus]
MELKQVAAQNQRVVAAGRYETEQGDQVEVASLLAAAVAGTRRYEAAELLPQLTGPTCLERTADDDSTRDDSTRDEERSAGAKTTIEVTGEDTVTAARRLVAASAVDRVAVLNFASARHPGGGYLNGARAQEEDLCRKTLLYPCLIAASGYYAAHESARDPFYSHRSIYSPGVPVIRDQRDRLTAPVVTVDVITCAAPNAGAVRRVRPDLAERIPQVLVERAGVVLAAAARHGARRLVLGAWGCGVFRNDPRQVAAAFRTHLVADGAFRAAFTHVTFAVLDRSAQQPNLRAFREAFAG